MIDIEILNKLNAPTKEERLENLKKVMQSAKFPPMVDEYINNHIHTTFSFSPYSPTAAVFAARSEGLCTAGIVDHDSIAGAREFIEAGKIAAMPVTIGMECRASMDGTSMEGKRTNNPDQSGVSYVTLQGVPHEQIDTLNAYFAPYREKRNTRTKAMCARINELLGAQGIELDFARDVLPLSEYQNGGGVTERHLMLALANALLRVCGRGEAMIAFLQKLGLSLSQRQKDMLSDTAYPFYAYDVLGILKGAFVPKIFIPATEECPRLTDVASLASRVDAVLCYAYLGDVKESVTGDKKAQTFEDAYLEDVFRCLKDCGVKAITYMPTRNTKEQLKRLRALCDTYGMFQVSGEDINSPRQSFVIKAMEDPMFKNLIDATWKLIAHEKTGEKII